MNNYIPPNLPVYIEEETPENKAFLPMLVVAPLELMAREVAATKVPARMSLIDFLWEYKVKLVFGIFAIFFVSYSTVSALGFLPESLKAAPAAITAEVISSDVLSVNTITTASATEQVATAISATTTTAKPALEVKKVVAIKAVTRPIVSTLTRGGQDPLRVIINKIGVDTKISNPASTNPTTLDTNLQRGAVRYYGSAGLGAGNTFIFAHSTNHPVVINQAYKAFNNFDKLVAGDTITVYSIDRIYTYKVEKVRLARADEVYVDLSTNTNMITLSTCNTFGEKAERYVVEASFVQSAPIVENTI